MHCAVYLLFKIYVLIIVLTLLFWGRDRGCAPVVDLYRPVAKGSWRSEKENPNPGRSKIYTYMRQNTLADVSVSKNFQGTIRTHVRVTPSGSNLQHRPGVQVTG